MKREQLDGLIFLLSTDNWIITPVTGLSRAPKRSRNRVLMTIHRCILIFPEILDGFYFLDTVL